MSWTFYNASGEALVQHAESEATKAEMEAESATPKFVPPDLVRNSPGVAKVWVYWTQSGGHGVNGAASYNYTSASDGGVGVTDHLWDVDMSGTAYVVVGGGEWDGSPPNISGDPATTGCQTRTGDSNHAAADSTRQSLAVFGDA